MRSSLVRQVVQFSVIVMIVALLLFWRSSAPRVSTRAAHAIRVNALWAPGSDGIEIMRVSLCELGVIGGARLNESFRLRPNPMCHEGSFKIEQSRLKVWVNAEAHGPMLDLPPPGAVSNSAVTP